MIEKILEREAIIGIIIRNTYIDKGLHFITPDSFSQQLAYMSHPRGHVISPHYHNSIKRVIFNTLETLFVKSGKVRIDFFDSKQSYVQSKLLGKGDVVLLSGGGHGFVMLEDSEILEVKQGPFVGAQEKTRFDSIDEGSIRYEESIYSGLRTSPFRQ